MLKTAKVVGLNSDTDVALAQVFSSDGVNLFTIVSCSFEEAFIKTRQTLFDAQDTFSSAEGSISEKIGSTLNFIKEALNETENLQIIVGAICEDEIGSVFYLQSLGDSLVTYLLREGKKNDLGSMSEGALVSGILKPGDRVVMATKSLVELLEEEEGSLSGFPLESLEDEVASLLPEADPYPVAAVVAEVENILPLPEEIDEELSPDTNLGSSPKINFKEVLSTSAKTLITHIPRSKKVIAVLACLLIGFIFLGTFIGARQKKDSEVVANFEKNYSLALENFNKAKQSKDTDQVASLAGWASAKTSLDEALKIKPGDSRALDLKKEMEEISGDILKVYMIENIPVWLDLDLIKKGLSAKKLSLSLGNILILDENLKVLVQIGIQNKSQESLAGQDKLGEALLSSLNGEIAWVYSEDKGIIRIDTKSKEAKVVIKKDDEWGEISEVFGFASNLYLLDSNKNQIWKYVPVVSGYSDKQSYFKEGVKVDITDVKKFQIDSSVWVLRGNGEILKYTQGSTDFFSLSGLDKPINNPKSIFVSDKTENFYLLDSGNNRLLVLDKKGNYKSQYQFDKLGTFSDLVVDETGKKVYLLDGSKIYSMDLR